VSAPDALIADRYRVLRLVGRGGMGVVWEGWDERLHRSVAIKQLHSQPGLSTTDAEIANERAMREARITARLHHPYAVSVFDVVEHEGQPCLVMQFVPSQPLSAVLRERGPLPPEGAARMGAQISSALAAAHQVGIVHRDVKPGNILIGDDGTARISDFGISHALGDVTLTMTGMVTGTPAFLSPEVARGAEATFHSDVFSLGATLYAAVEGTPPFGSGQNSMALLHKVALGEVIPPSRSGVLTPLLMRMLATDPADRPSMGHVAQALSGGTPEGPRTAPHTATQRLARPGTGAAAAPAALEPSPTEVSAGTPDRRPWEPVASSAAGFASPARTSGAASAEGRPTASPPPTGPTDPTQPARRRRRNLAWAAVAVLVLLGLGVLASGLLPLTTGVSQSPTDTTQAPAPKASTATAESSSSPTAAPSSGETSPSPARSSSPSPARSSSPSPAPSSATASGKGQPTAAQLNQAITSYYRLIPDDTDEAWTRMTESYQRNQTGGREAYENFWDPVDRVSVSNVKGTPPDQVVATISYFFDDDRVVVERTSFGLVNDGGVLKINSSSVLNSSTR
jgi:serine/threonine protein kinase